MLKISQSIILLFSLLFGNCEIFSKAHKASSKKSRSIKKKKSGKKKKKRSTRRKKGKKSRRGAPSLKMETRPPTHLVQAQPLPSVQPQISEADVASQKAALAQREKEIAVEKEKEIERKKILEMERKQREEQERLEKEAVKIQAAYRGYREREKLKKEKGVETKAEEQEQREIEEGLERERLAREERKRKSKESPEENFKKIGDAIEDMLNIEKAYEYRKNLVETTIAGEYTAAFTTEKLKLWQEVKDLYNKSNFPAKVNQFLYSLDQFIKNAEVELSVVKEEIVEGEQCAVCSEELADLSLREELGEIVQLKCSHQFHRKCIKQWLETESVCPLCRHETVHFTPDKEELEIFLSLLSSAGWKSNELEAKDRLTRIFRSEKILDAFNTVARSGNWLGGHNITTQELARELINGIFPPTRHY